MRDIEVVVAEDTVSPRCRPLRRGAPKDLNAVPLSA
jgi:hypothetical protein